MKRNNIFKGLGFFAIIAVVIGIIFFSIKSDEVHAREIANNSTFVHMSGSMASHMAQMKDMSTADKLHMKAEMKEQFGDNWKQECNRMMEELDKAT